MTEQLLQFIWRFQYYNHRKLTSAKGESIHVISPGTYNTNQGPDFFNAKIRIAQTLWVGNVELHLCTSGWKKHGHDGDPNYSNVILHVVWEDDEAENNHSVPVLELKTRISKILLDRYRELMNSTSFIPCEKLIHTIPDLNWKSWQERLLAERLIRKASTVGDYLKQCQYNWEEVFWWLLARNFGMKVNADAFEEVARSLPLKILRKHRNQIHQLEALLLGQAGLLKEDKSLQAEEYAFYNSKYQLKKTHTRMQFLRMRPGSFPSVRLGQLAILIHNSAHLFSEIKESASVADVKKCFAGVKKKRLGDDMVNNIIINSVVPILFAYGEYYKEEQYKLKALRWLEEIETENNSIIKGFRNLNIKSNNAFDSQALIELKTQYCDCKNCLNCGVGNWLLKS